MNVPFDMYLENYRIYKQDYLDSDFLTKASLVAAWELSKYTAAKGNYYYFFNISDYLEFV